MNEEEYRSIISEELRRLRHDQCFPIGLQEVLPGEPVALAPAVLRDTDSGGLYDVQLILIRKGLSPEQKLASFYHEVGHLQYSWSRTERSSSSPWDDERFAYQYMFERLVSDGRRSAVGSQLERLEQRLKGNPPPHYRQAIEFLTQSPLWAEWKQFAGGTA